MRSSIEFFRSRNRVQNMYTLVESTELSEQGTHQASEHSRAYHWNLTENPVGP